MCLQRTGGKPESKPHAWPWLTAQSLVLNLSNLLQETNSHYNFHRDYKPNQGRYIQSDPIGTDGGVNLYGYSYVNPLTYIDTTGEVPWIGLPALYCVRFPRVCKEILRCIINPRACKKKLCRFGNAIYAACHSLPTCAPCRESCVASQGKMAFLTTCYTLRLSMSRCYNDNPSPNDGHAQQLADIARKMPVCMEAISVNCSGCCGY